MIRNLNYLVLALSVISLCCISMRSLNTLSVDRNITMRDTFFLKKEIREGKIYHNIYIDSTRNPAIFNPFYGLDNQDSLNIQAYLQTIEKRNITLNKFNMYGLDSEWLPVYKLNSQYYLYKPSDSGNKSHKILTDSLMLYYWMDGYRPVAIESVSKKSDNAFTLKGQQDVPEDRVSLAELNIYIIDKKRMLTVWEYKIGDATEFRYKLMIPKQFANQFSVL